MTAPDQSTLAPGLLQLLRESRAPLEAAAFLIAARQIDGLPRGDGHPVMFLPGFAMGDEALRPMSRAIGRLGYAVYGWDQGRNLGLRSRVLQSLLKRAADLRRQHAADVSLVGWSAGGLYAREMARLGPGAIRRIITLGAPIDGSRGAQPLVGLVVRAFDTLQASRGNAGFVPQRAAPPVPCTAIHSKTDGVVAWQSSLEAEGPTVENVEVTGTHLALGFNLDVLRIIATRLAAAVGGGTPDAPYVPDA